MKSTRRNLLKTTGAVGGMAAGALAGLGAVEAGSAMTFSAEAGAVSPDIEGTWLATVSLDIPDVAPFPVLVSFARGGTLISSDSGMPPESGNLYLGTWTKSKSREYSFTFLGFQFEKGQLATYIRGTETLRVESDGKSYKGVTKIEILDKNMNPVQTSFGTTLAKRVDAV